MDNHCLSRSTKFLDEVVDSLLSGDKSLYHATITLCAATLRAAHGLPESFHTLDDCSDIGVEMVSPDETTMCAYAEWKGKYIKATWDLDAYEPFIRSAAKKVKAALAHGGAA